VLICPLSGRARLGLAGRENNPDENLSERKNLFCFSASMAKHSDEGERNTMQKALPAKNKPELLAPAGDMEKLETALAYGADAVYVGSSRFGLRALAGNFTLAELVQARQLTSASGKRIYFALNAYLRPAEQAPLEEYLEELRTIDLDAYIVSDPGVLAGSASG
jgi:hypothetical protein